MNPPLISVPGTAVAAADSFVWMAEQDELAAERVFMLLRLQGGGGVPARAVGGAVRELQRYVGCAERVLETKHMRCKCAKEKKNVKCRWRQRGVVVVRGVNGRATR